MKPTANIVLRARRLDVFPLDQEQDEDVYSCYFYSTFYQRCQAGQLDKKETKGTQIGKIKTFLFTDDMNLYKENLKDPAKLLELIKESMQDCKVQAHYTKTSCIFVYSNEQSENDNSKTGPITNSFQTNKQTNEIFRDKLNKRSTRQITK